MGVCFVCFQCFFIPGLGFSTILKQINKQTPEQTNKQTRNKKKTNKQTNKKQTNKQTDKQQQQQQQQQQQNTLSTVECENKFSEVIKIVILEIFIYIKITSKVSFILHLPVQKNV